MDYPIDRIAFSKFIRHSNIFELTRVAMAQCLESWYNDEREQFLDDMIGNGIAFALQLVLMG